jgi:hypothetical protein
MVERHTPLATFTTGVILEAASQDMKRTTERRFSDISIFCAWSSTAKRVADRSEKKKVSAEPAESPEAPSSPDAVQSDTTEDSSFVVVADDISLTVWRAKRISAVPTDEQGRFTLADLRTVIPRLIADAHDKAAPPGVPLYYVLHIGTVEKISKRPPWWRSQRQSTAEEGATGGLAGRPVLELETFKDILDMLDEVRTEMGLTLTPENVSTIDADLAVLDAAYYEHYSPLRRARGYLVLDPRFSVVVDCAEEDVLALLTMLQQSHLTRYGLTPSGYAAVQMRVSLWDSNSDVHASLDDLAKVSRDGAASVLGSILLSFALAGIGTLLALTPLLGTRSGQLVAPMFIYALASIFHAFFALTTKKIFNLFGVLCLILATALAIVIFAVPSFVMPFLPTGR